MFSQDQLQEINQLIANQSEKIVILTHHNPDGDAIGSSLALYHYLKNKNIESTIIVPNEFPKFLKWMPEAKKIIIAELRKKHTEILIKNANVIFCLDFNATHRIESLKDFLEHSKATKILIDHHQQPENFDFVYSDTSQPATCQMIYKFINAMNDNHLIDRNIATCLYSGLLTDTGSFRFRNTTSETHRIVADLLEKGAEPDYISSNILDSNSVSRLKLLGLLLEKMLYFPENKSVILHLTKDELLQFGYQKGDTEGFVNYGLSIKGIVFSALILDDLYNDYRRISLRSKGNFDVNNFARSYFNGGGHTNAAGGKSFETMEVTLKRMEILIKNENELQ